VAFKTNNLLLITTYVRDEALNLHCSNGNVKLCVPQTYNECDVHYAFLSYLLKFRYADLKNNRLTDYTFSYEKMLSDKVH
jgi:hypothetical protein